MFVLYYITLMLSQTKDAVLKMLQTRLSRDITDNARSRFMNEEENGTSAISLVDQTFDHLPLTIFKSTSVYVFLESLLKA